VRTFLPWNSKPTFSTQSAVFCLSQEAKNDPKVTAHKRLNQLKQTAIFELYIPFRNASHNINEFLLLLWLT
jgi:hypothetical protein